MKNFSFNEAKAMAQEEIQIKGHDCFLINFNNSKLSILVYKDGKHIYYVDDFGCLHNHLVKEKGIEALRQYYIDKMNNILFTDEELMDEVASYDEYRRKDHFLRNYWIMRYDYTSIFAISGEDKKKVERGKKVHPYYCTTCFCYVGDPAICDQANMYRDHLQKVYEKLLQSDDEFRRIISYELSNHEACITGSADEALDALGLDYETLSNSQKEIVNQELKKQYRY